MSDNHEYRSFTKEWLEDNGLPYEFPDSEFEDTIGSGRWYDYRTVTFKAPDDGLWYQLVFEIGKTENQWCSWDECLDFPVKCFRVERVEVVRHEWQLVKK